MRVVSFISSSLLLALAVQAQLGPGRETGTSSDATATSDDALPPAPTESTGCVRAETLNYQSAATHSSFSFAFCRLLMETIGIALAEPTDLRTVTTTRVMIMNTKKDPAMKSSLTPLAKDACSTAHTTTVLLESLLLAQLSLATMI